MSRTHYVTITMTLSDAEACENATDLIRNEHEADGRKREALRYERASRRITEALQAFARANPHLFP